jgi:hypothetical protein
MYHCSVQRLAGLGGGGGSEILMMIRSYFAEWDYGDEFRLRGDEGWFTGTLILIVPGIWPRKLCKSIGRSCVILKVPSHEMLMDCTIKDMRCIYSQIFK